MISIYFNNVEELQMLAEACEAAALVCNTHPQSQSRAQHYTKLAVRLHSLAAAYEEGRANADSEGRISSL